MRLGVLDVGSNTVHLLVVDAHRGAEPTPQHSDKSELKLAELIDKKGDLSAKGADALVRTVMESRRQAKSLGCDELLAFATSAVREGCAEQRLAGCSAEDVGERAEHNRARDRADHRTRAAEQARAADDDRGDRGELVAGAVIGAAEVELARMDDARNRRNEAGDRVDGDLYQRDRHAREPRRPLVTADREDIAAKAGEVQHEGRDRRDNDEDQRRHRHDIVEQPVAENCEYRRCEPRPLAIGNVDILLFEITSASPRATCKPGERDDERLEPEAGRDQALRCAEGRAAGTARRGSSE